MQITARLDESTLRAILGELLPVTILLDEKGKEGGEAERWVAIEPAHQVDFVAGQGLRLRTSGRIHWTAAGVPLEATLHSVQLMLRPEIAPDRHGGRLVFRPSLESADLKNVPSLLDRGIVALVNRQLEARGEEMSWDFGRTLGFSVSMPSTLVGPETLQLNATKGTVTVSNDAVELSLTILLHFLHSAAT